MLVVIARAANPILTAVRTENRVAQAIGSIKRSLPSPGQWSSNLDRETDGAAAIERAEKRLGRTNELDSLLVRCLLAINREGAALPVVRRIAPIDSELRQKVESRIQIRASVHALSPKAPPIVARQLGPNLWAVLLAKESPFDGFYRRCFAGLRLGVFDASKSAWTVPPFEIVDEGCYYPQLFVWRSPSGRTTLVTSCSFPAASCPPSCFKLYELASGRLKKVGKLDAVYSLKAWPQRDKLVLLDQLVYKIGWIDMYEWNGIQMAFANSKHPRIYNGFNWKGSPFAMGRERTRLDYTNWLDVSARAACQGRWKDCKVLLQRAERVCKICIQEQVKGRDPYEKGAHPDYQFHGDTTANLREIRRRLRWLASKDYDHALLYRPLDFDLQIPPYKLGNSLRD